MISGTVYTPEQYASTAQGEWYGKNWGATNQGWICPAAPEKKTNAWTMTPYSAPPDLYQGSVDSAWVISERVGWYRSWFWGGIPERRAGSYAPNSWISGGAWWWNRVIGSETDPLQRERFYNENQIRDNSRTPVFADGISAWWTGAGWSSGPRATDLPAKDLMTGSMPGPYGMGMFTIPRHGSRPRSVPRDFNPRNKLPGAINVSFYDGHVEQVKLEHLWSLYWHKDWQTPPKRPGL
jgi:prepilin-type processing-associated H-X9-DG protein